MNTGAAAGLAGCGFPQRWASAEGCVLLQTHFGDGQGVLASWHAWHALRKLAGGGPLVLVSIVGQPPEPGALQQAHAGAPWAALAADLAAQWPPATPDLHVLDLEPGVRLLLAMGQRPWLRLLRLQADVVLFDAGQPPPGAAAATPWDGHALKALGRLASPQAVWPGLPGSQAPAGAAQGPQPLPRAPHDAAAPGAAPSAATGAARVPARVAAHAAPARRHAVVIGAGIAGACAARALARAGWDCTVLDARDAPAQGASGNAAGLFHGTVHPGDGLHARFTRACALHAAQLMRTMLQAGVPGNAGGLLRAHAQQQATMPHGQPWPAGWVQRLDADAVQQRVPGLRADNAWWFPGGGWVAAADAVRWLLQTPGVRFQGRAAVHTLQRTGNDWHLLDASGHTLAHAQAVVLATAGAWPLLRCNGAPGAPQPAALPPPRYSRGQITWFDTPATLPHPVAGHGYALSGHAGQLLCGASTEPVGPPDPGAHAGDNRDAEPRDSDHQFNLQRLATLTGIAPPPGAPLHGRVGWRHLTMDRLPLVGAVPGAVQAQRIERLRDVAREPNLWLLAGLGGRGFTWAPLLGEVVAALAGAGPLPIETGLLDAADPARHMLRQARRAAAG